MSSQTRPTTWLVTGTSRGIGLEIARQLAENPNNVVVATCRTPSKATALNALKDTAKGKLHVVGLDVSDFDEIRALLAVLEPILGEYGLDYLINNAATYTQDTAFTIDPETMVDVYRVNAVAPALLSKVLLPLLEKAGTKKILNISSTSASFQAAGTLAPIHQKITAYSMSKSALNMLTYRQKVDRPDFTVIALCPGWVKTDMGGDEALLDPQESISGIIDVITKATTADSGRFLRYNWEELPW
ncbi:NAD-P-binding protein [Trametes polyzona]|nr:NAD-P-binding protein [Trametes polyzona]